MNKSFPLFFLAFLLAFHPASAETKIEQAADRSVSVVTPVYTARIDPAGNLAELSVKGAPFATQKFLKPLDASSKAPSPFENASINVAGQTVTVRSGEARTDWAFGEDSVDNSAAGKNTAFFITGLPGHDLENIRFSDISMVAEGGGTAEEGAQRDVIEFDDETLDGWWPGIHIVEGREGVLPLHGFFARHVRGLHLDQADFSSVATDARPAVILENVRDVSLSSISTNPDAAGEAALRLRNVQGARLSNFVPPPSGALLLQVEGTASARIHLDSSTTHTTNQ
jgi:hypothetical protein